jgi:hypothetical protein
MAKIVLSGVEFELLCEHFRAPKEGRHVRWRDFSDSIDEVFTKKGLEMLELKPSMAAQMPMVTSETLSREFLPASATGYSAIVWTLRASSRTGISTNTLRYHQSSSAKH